MHTKITTLLLAFGISCTALFACGGSIEKRSAKVNTDNLATLRTQAEFEFECPAAELELRCMLTVEHICRNAGVTGCGKRALYKLVQVSAYRSDWIVNSISEPEAAPASSPSPQNAQPPVDSPRTEDRDEWED